MHEAPPRRALKLNGWLAFWSVVLATPWSPAARADRSSENMDPAYMYEKAKQFDKAAMYYGRAVRGLREIYIAFHWNGDPAANAPGKYSREYVQIPKEMDERYRKCLGLAGLRPARIGRMAYLNYLWMTEMVDEEGGGLRTAVALIAPEAEKYGDFRLAEFLRRGEVRYCRVVAVPFHERCAKELGASGQKALAACHRRAAGAYEAQAKRAEMLAKGDKVLLRVPGLGGPGHYIGELRLYPAKVGPVGFQYIPRRLFTKAHEPKGPSPKELAKLLEDNGLRQEDEAARFAAVTALARLGEGKALLSAFSDPSPTVRLAAARGLAAMHWADGWEACHGDEDAAIRATIAPLLEPAGKHVLARTYAVTALIRGLASASARTRAFSQKALERITGKTLAPNAWGGWWKTLGNARPGLTRRGPGAPPQIDETIDFGAWWQVVYQKAPNPLAKYRPPATIQWDGHLVVPRSGRYRFYARNCGEGRHSGNAVRTPGRMGFPGLYLSAPAAKLVIDGKQILPHATDAVQDPCGGIRLDLSEPIELAGGLHKIHVEFSYRSPRDRRKDLLAGQPCLRLYWSSDHFLRTVIPVDALVTKD